MSTDQTQTTTRPIEMVLSHFHEIVEPTVAEFLGDPGNKQRGVLAALVIASMAEHFYAAFPNLSGGALGDFISAIHRYVFELPLAKTVCASAPLVIAGISTVEEISWPLT